jgi:transposase-like protein
LATTLPEPSTIDRLSPAWDADAFWADPSWFRNLAETEDRCRAFLETERWPDGVMCPRCAAQEPGTIPARKKFYCRSCSYQFSVTAGTIFHNSHLPVWKWFLAISVMLDSQDGVPANQLVRLLGGSYKTAWFVQHRVRAAIEEAQRGHARFDLAVSGGRDHAHERLFDRNLVGAYHQMARKYVRFYRAETEWRSASRRNPNAFEETVRALLAAEPIPYVDLIR